MTDNIIRVRPASLTIYYDVDTHTQTGNNSIKAESFTALDVDHSAPFIIEGIQPYFLVQILPDYNVDSGTYQYPVTFMDNEGSVPVTINVNIVVSNSSSGGGGEGGGTEPPDPPAYDTPYGLKYWLENNGYRLEILKRNYEGEYQEITGTVTHSYQGKTETFQPVVASTLSVSLDASTDLTLTDIYSEEEQVYKAILKRGEQVIFRGFVKPDGIYEDWVSDRWVLDLDAVDGLGQLKNLSFVDAGQNTFTGKMALIDIVKSCLQRTGLNLPINVCIELIYNGMPDICVLEAVKLNTERFYQDGSSKSSDVMDCEAVLTSVLRVFNATCLQMNGEWFVVRLMDLKEGMKFYRFCDDCTMSTWIYNPARSIGSHVNGAEIFHCNANQKKSISPSVQAYRVYYKYGLAQNILTNGELKMGAGLNSEGWTVNNVQRQRTQRDTVREPSGYGFYIEGNTGDKSDGYSNSDDILNWQTLFQLNQNLQTTQNDSLSFRVNMYSRANSTPLYVRFYISTPNFYLIDGRGWVAKSESSNQPAGSMSWQNHNGDLSWEATTPAAPENGDITFYMQVTGGNYLNRNNYWKLGVRSVSVIPSETNLKGIYYTGQRTRRTSTVKKENVTVYNGDSESNIYVGTLYKQDGITSTSYWNRKGYVEEKNLLAINVEDNLFSAPRPMVIFEGDIYGYIPILSLISISGVAGVFHVFKYSNKTAENVISLESTEVEYALLEPNDYYINSETDSGNETKVTIRS